MKKLIAAKISESKLRFLSWLIVATIAQSAMYIASAAAAETRTLASDPVGDTHGALATQPDIERFFATIVDGNLVFTVSFFDLITPADSGQANAVIGSIDIDTDQDSTTGATANADFSCPAPSGMGMDYFVDIGSYDSATRQAELVDSTSTTVASVDVVFTENSFTATVPLTALDGDDGITNVATVLGTVDEPTDCAPNGGFITTDFGSMINVSTNAPILDSNGFVVGVIVNDGPVRVALTGESNGALGASIADASIELIEILSNEVLASNDDCSDDDVAELEEIIGRSLGSATDACLVLTLDIGLYGLRLKDASKGAGFGLAGATQKR